MTHLEDQALAARVLARDPDAVRSFAERVACVAGYVRGAMRRAGVRHAEAAVDDVVQETYLALWRKLPSFQGQSRLETWAVGFAVLELRRWRVRGARDLARVGEDDPEPEVQGAMPDDLAELVERALEHIGPPASDVIRLKHFEELTFPSIGERLDLSPNTAKSLYYRGLARLRAWLGSRGEGLLP